MKTHKFNPKAVFGTLITTMALFLGSQSLVAVAQAHTQATAAVEQVSSPLGEYQVLLNQIHSTLQQSREQKKLNLNNGSDRNTPVPEVGDLIVTLKKKLAKDPNIQKKVKTDRAFRAFYTQTQNTLKHISFSFTIRDNTYTHEYVLNGPYPYRPTEIAVQKTQDFLEAANTHEVLKFTPQPENLVREQELADQQKELIKKVTNDSFSTYQNMRQRLIDEGPEASFAEELGPVVYQLELKLNSDPTVVRLCNENPSLSKFRNIALEHLHKVINPTDGKPFPYLSSVEAIQHTLEFFDVLHRANDPTRSPKLYHSFRYDYYGHYLKAQIPDHIIMPTVASIGATDILKARGVPISFIGVNTEVMWVDGFYQTPYEFWVHDINHSRRMFQFFSEKAKEIGMSIEDFAKVSDTFVKEQLMPLISIKKGDSDLVKNKKRLIKVLLFEILHEDALAAHPEVVRRAILRPPNLITPFERIDDDVVSYVMEPGATTLAYVYRKLAHDFYDMPGQRIDNIVAPEFRTRENIVEAAETLSKHLGFKISREVLEYFVSTDQGFPHDFKQTIIKDRSERPDATMALDQENGTGHDHAIAIVADTFHELWQTNSGYSERWKLAQATLRDGRGVNDDFVIDGPTLLQQYLDEKQIPQELRKYFQVRVNPKTGKRALYEDIQHLPNRYLAANNQFENTQGAALAVEIIDRIPEKHLEFRTVEEGKAWLKDALQEMNAAWLRRNGHWAKAYPQYDREWKDLAGGKQQNGVNLLKTALETEGTLNPGSIANSQRALLQESIQRIEIEIIQRRETEVRIDAGADRIHEEWRRTSGYSDRWKSTGARLDDGTLVVNDTLLKRYFAERQIPQDYQRYYRLVPGIAKDVAILQADIQNLPYQYLSDNFQHEHTLASAEAVNLVDRIWKKHLKFRDIDDVERWLTMASQMLHVDFIKRIDTDADGVKYPTHWTDLPSASQRNNLDRLLISFKARFQFKPDGMGEAQEKLIVDGILRLKGKIEAGLDLNTCTRNLRGLAK